MSEEILQLLKPTRNLKRPAKPAQKPPKKGCRLTAKNRLADEPDPRDERTDPDADILDHAINILRTHLQKALKTELDNPLRAQPSEKTNARTNYLSESSGSAPHRSRAMLSYVVSPNPSSAGLLVKQVQGEHVLRTRRRHLRVVVSLGPGSSRRIAPRDQEPAQLRLTSSSTGTAMRRLARGRRQQPRRPAPRHPGLR